jgi:hypothetical protein
MMDVFDMHALAGPAVTVSPAHGMRKTCGAQSRVVLPVHNLIWPIHAVGDLRLCAW